MSPITNDASTITIDGVDVEGSRARYATTPTGGLRRFFTGDDLRVRYGTDVSSVPDAVLLVPVLAQVCPVAWATGATVRTPLVDREFLESLRAVEETLLDMYPEFVRGGSFVADEVVDCSTGRGEETGMLFTGGVDSTATYLNHRNEDPYLITIRGWVVKSHQSEEWREQQAFVEAFAERRGLRTRFVESNVHSFLNPGMLDAHYRRYLHGSWYAAVGGGLGLLGLCAPLAAADGIGDLHIAATLHDGIDDVEWGSLPSIDDNVRWAGTRCHHDGFSMSRQDKLERIASFLEESDRSLTVQSCNRRLDNCSRCSKCLRTMVGLALAGIDPNRVGYDYDEDVFDRVRDRFDDPAFYGYEDDYYWTDIQDHVDLDREFPGDQDRAEAFFRWLADADLDAVFADSRPPLGTRVKHAAIRLAPYSVYSTLSSLAEWTGGRPRSNDPEAT